MPVSVPQPDPRPTEAASPRAFASLGRGGPGHPLTLPDAIGISTASATAGQSARWDRDPIVRRLVISDAGTMPEPTPSRTRPLDEDPPADAADAAPERDCVDDCGDASFPASDPPSWWSGR
jgi:hypothetical protein